MPLINLNEPQTNSAGQNTDGFAIQQSQLVDEGPNPVKFNSNNGSTNQPLINTQQVVNADQTQVKPQLIERNAGGSITNQNDISNNLQQKIAETKVPQVQGNLQQKQYKLADILAETIKQNASDIHLTVGYRAMIRVDGELRNLNSGILTPADMHAYCSEVVASRNDIDLEIDKDIDLGYSFHSRRFRVNIFRQQGNLSFVARLVPEKIKSIDELNLPSILKELSKTKSGLILVVGPTGSGKSTTLSSMLNHINTNRKEHMITLEDPIEFLYPQAQSIIEQRELGMDFSDWKVALKSILRQDPDIVLVGEMRDIDTIESTITVAETGHLVFATLHTNSAAQTIDRIIDVFPEEQQSQIRSQLATVVTAVISQRLVPLNNGGRKAVMELMIANPAIKNTIREGKTHQLDNMIQTGQDYGMISMEKSLVELVRSGQINPEQARNYSLNPDTIDMLMNGSR